MSFLTSILLGLVQGVTEFLPISSSGHLAIASQLLNMDGTENIPQFFDVLLHLGTLVAVFIAYWPEIWEMILEFFRGVRDIAHHSTPDPLPPARRMILLVIVGTLPLFAVLPFKDRIEGLSDNLYVVAAALILTGFLLFFSDRVRKGRKKERSARMTDALIVGISQAFATCPGLSRSGTTISVGMMRGFDRAFAVRFSFLMSLPAVLGANVLEIKDALASNFPIEELPMYLVGVAVSAVVGYFAIRLVKSLSDKGKFGKFAYYCWAVGLGSLVAGVVKMMLLK